MRSAIAIIMAMLGTILVLSGAASLWASALVRPRAGNSGPGETTTMAVADGTRLTRTADVVSRVPGPDRLIVWGVVLLALSAVAAGAITVSATATAGTR